MNYNEIGDLLDKIVIAQKFLAESPPTLPKDPEKKKEYVSKKNRDFETKRRFCRRSIQ